MPPAHASPGRAAVVNDALGQRGAARPYERHRDDPPYRPLRIFALDSATSPREGGIATVRVPYEPLKATPHGWAGALFEIDTRAGDPPSTLRYRSAPLDEMRALAEAGVAPSISDPAFPQQMAYAVCMMTYQAFWQALGRPPRWSFGAISGSKEPPRLRVRPFAKPMANAYYSQTTRSLDFGYYRAVPVVDRRNLPEGIVFTSVSHDIVAHEVTHALLDGLRTHFLVATNPDVPAFHEALGDLVALFERFNYRAIVRRALAETRGDLRKANTLTEIAQQYGDTTGLHAALRSALHDHDGQMRVYERNTLYPNVAEPHARGMILVEAVFEAFLTIYERKRDALVRLATGGSGHLPDRHHLSDSLLDALADKASSLARQFLTMCIRAVDYCPPVDIEFGEFLRAAITADYDLVPDDPWGYREAWVDAFRRRGIYPSHVTDLSLDALLWRMPPGGTRTIDRIGLSSADPDLTEVARANVVAAYLSQPGRLGTFWLPEPGTQPDGTRVEPACVQSVRTSRRIGPDRRMHTDLVVEVVQRSRRLDSDGQPRFYYGGTTLIVDPKGSIRYSITKNPTSERRAKRQRAFMHSRHGHDFWTQTAEGWAPVPNAFRLLHAHEQGHERE